MSYVEPLVDAPVDEEFDDDEDDNVEDFTSTDCGVVE